MRRSIPISNRRRFAKHRRGTSVVEFAVCMPLIMLIVLGAIEATSMIFLKQSLQAAAYEGSRRAIRIDGTEVQARNVCEEILDARNVEDYQFSFPLGDPGNAARGQDTAVEISASSARNSPIGGRFLGERRVTVRTTMVKE